MSLPIAFLPEAERDLNEAFEWYESQRRGLGLDLIGAVDETLSRIGQNPMAYGMVHRDLRKATARRFPYSIVFRVEQEQVLVVAVFHAKRDPQI